MKALAPFAIFLGLALLAALTLYEGVGAVARALALVGVGAIWIVLARFAQTAFSGLAWRALLADADRPSLATFCNLRWVRELINNLLPVAQVGGDLIGARLLSKAGAPGGLAAASVIVDLLAQTATQIVFTLIGAILLFKSGVQANLVLAAFVGLLVMTPALAGFWMAPRLMRMDWFDRLAARVEDNPRWATLGSLHELRAGMDLILSRRAGLAAALALHMFIWFVGVLEIWIALALLGQGQNFVTATVVESLGHAVKAAGFLIPGALGVQEGGFIALCAAFSIASPTALALSLVKRIPDLVCGLPGLISWQFVEGKGLFAGRASERRFEGDVS